MSQKIKSTRAGAVPVAAASQSAMRGGLGYTLIST